MPAPEIVQFPNGNFVENTYLVADPESGDAVMVDPGEEAARLLARLEMKGWTLKAIWLTHAHIDHIAGVADVKDRFDVPILLHPADRPLYDHCEEQGLMFGLRLRQPPPPDGELAEGRTVSVGSCEFGILHTPGHSPGSVTFVTEGLALSGDVLFNGSVGRTDLPGGDTATLLASIRKKLFLLPNETRVLSGHGMETTIGAEKLSNPFVKLVPGINACLRCGAEVRPKPWGCKNPCDNCGFVYPLGDCSD